MPGIRKNGKPCYKPLEILCKHHASVPARSRAGTASQGVYGARATLRGLPRSCPTSRLFRDDIYRALLESMAEKGRPWFGPIYSEEEVQSRRCAPRPANHGDGPQARPALTGLETCARSPQWVREPRANPSLPLRQRAQPRGCFAAGPHAEGAARLPITGPSSGDSATAERETPEGHHGSAGSRTEHSSLPRLEKWCSSFFSEPRLKSSIHFPIL